MGEDSRHPENLDAQVAEVLTNMSALIEAAQISGGEKQRVALARALINDPLIVMGDEPTGNLDKKNSEIVFDLFQRMADELKQTLLIVTHDTDFAQKTERIIELDDGRIIKG